MRPLKLKISAFGPYSGVNEFDFEKLGANGLYLITGTTGAGKTTIFDAITYALYGAASGQNRDTSMLRSKYADLKTPTEVELVFSYRDKEYKISRNPEYERMKLNGTGTTTEKANAELVYPDGRVVTKVKDVDNAVKEIIGIDRNQFCQIAMIAQGDFLKLLLADTKERIEIFRHIFKTELFRNLQEQLKLNTGELSKKCDEVKNSITQYISGIACDEDNVDFIEVGKAKNGELIIEDVIALLEKLIADDEGIETKIEKDKSELQKQLDEIKAIVNKAKDIEMAKVELQKNKEELDRQSENQKILTKQFEVEKDKKPEIEKIQQQVAKLEMLLPEYDELTAKQTAFDNNNKFIEDNTKVIEKIQTAIKDLEAEIDSLTKEGKDLEKAGEEKIKAENEKKALMDNTDKLKKLQKDIVSLVKSKKEYDNALEVYKEKQDVAEKEDSKFKMQNRIYLEAQAGILADTLKDDEPCPVCGSTSHPHIAIKPENAPTKEDLEALQSNLDKANHEADDARTKASNLKGIVYEKKVSVLGEIDSLLGASDIKEAMKCIEEKLLDTQNQIAKADEKIRGMQKQIERKAEIEIILPKKAENLEQRKQQFTDITDEIKNKTAENSSLEKRIKELKVKLTFESKEVAENEMNVLVQKANQINEAYENATKAVNECNQLIASLKATRVEIEKRIDGDCDFDLEEKIARQENIENELIKIDSCAKDVHSRISTNKSILENIKQKSGDLVQTEKKYAWMKALSNTANGQISGKDKIMFETYIQMNYFDRIIARANTRLMIMTDGQYDLVRRKEALSKSGQSGLELDVIDHYNGSHRSVRTLSGGESFKASLALALGLADEIQSSAGGIKLDTMFVDEGFGSLDEESLSAAMKALTSLAQGNRLVGIISHVGELKQKIDKQIIVTKDKTGGSKAEIIA